MVRLPDGSADRAAPVLLPESSGVSGETRPPSVEDRAKNTKRAEASHLDSLDVVLSVRAPLNAKRTCS